MQNINDKRVLLVGGAGFIGHHLALQLSKQGAHVHVMDSLGVNNISHHAADDAPYANDPLLLPILFQRLDLLRKSGVPIYIGDASKVEDVDRVLNLVSPEIVVFLAAISHAVYSNECPLFAFENNLRSLHNVLASAYDSIDQFVYFSSSMVYGNFCHHTVDETTPCHPKGVYGHFKLMGEQMCRLYQDQFGLDFTAIRPSALYGRRCVSRRVSQVFIERAIRGDALVIEGDGSDSLDFTHVDDVVRGVISTIGNPAALNETFNITYGSARSLRDLVDILRDYFPDLQVTYAQQPKSYVKRGTLSIEKARRLLDFQPTDDLNVGYRKYIEWYLNSAELDSEVCTLASLTNQVRTKNEQTSASRRPHFVPPTNPR